MLSPELRVVAQFGRRWDGAELQPLDFVAVEYDLSLREQCGQFASDLGGEQDTALAVVGGGVQQRLAL